jgi:hypothetical protein
VEPARAVDRERQLAATERERLQHSRQAEVVVGVVVREKDLLELEEPDVAAEKLALRPFATVEEQTLAAAANERRRQAALGGGRGSGRPEEDDVEIHCGRFYCGRS